MQTTEELKSLEPIGVEMSHAIESVLAARQLVENMKEEAPTSLKMFILDTGIHVCLTDDWRIVTDELELETGEERASILNRFLEVLAYEVEVVEGNESGQEALRILKAEMSGSV